MEMRRRCGGLNCETCFAEDRPVMDNRGRKAAEPALGWLYDNYHKLFIVTAILILICMSALLWQCHK